MSGTDGSRVFSIDYRNIEAAAGGRRTPRGANDRPSVPACADGRASH